jgi:hypothetical protein
MPQAHRALLSGGMADADAMQKVLQGTTTSKS